MHFENEKKAILDPDTHRDALTVRLQAEDSEAATSCSKSKMLVTAIHHQTKMPPRRRHSWENKVVMDLEKHLQNALGATAAFAQFSSC